MNACVHRGATLAVCNIKPKIFNYPEYAWRVEESVIRTSNWSSKHPNAITFLGLSINTLVGKQFRRMTSLF